MLDDYGFEIYEENEFPIAYLLTFRTFGTWLHGDTRWSVSRTVRGQNERKLIPPNKPLHDAMAAEMKQPTFLLDPKQREVVEAAIAEVCRNRDYFLRAVNARTNHVHVVVTAQVKPEGIANSFKAYSTRQLRENGLVQRGIRVWSRGRSRRYLWKPRNVAAAIDYVLYSQGWIPFEEWCENWEPPEE